MLNRSRVSSKMDVQRLGQALARPGMDPRVNLTLAVVVGFSFDKDHGPFANVLLMPDGVEDTVRVGALYAGPGFGLYVPLGTDDEVLVAYPSGEFDHGGVIVSRLWSKSDKPPSEVDNNKEDLLLHVEKDKTLRIVMEGSGNAVIKADSGKVLLGDESGTKPVHRKDDHEDVGTLTLTLTGTTVLSGTYVDPDGVSTPVTSGTPIMLKGKANEGSSKVEAA